MIKSICFSVLTFVPSLFLAQVTIPVGHMPAEGDIFTFAQHTAVYSPKPISNGLYDFSDLNQDDTIQVQYKANDKLIDYPNSNLKLVEKDNDAATIYFKKEGNNLFLIDLSQVRTQIPISGAGTLAGTMKYISFPITESTNTTTTDNVRTALPKSVFSQFIDVDSILTGLIPGLPTGSQLTVDTIVVDLNFSLNFYADGSGKIKTPIDDNIDVIKIVRKIEATPMVRVIGTASLGPISIPVDQDVTSFIAGQLPLDAININMHSFYSPAHRQEIVYATLDSNGDYQAVNYRYKTTNGSGSGSGGSSSIMGSSQLKVQVEFQNDYIAVHNLQEGKDYYLRIYDLTGKVLVSEPISRNHNRIRLVNTNPVIIRVLGDEGRLHYSSKHKLDIN